MMITGFDNQPLIRLSIPVFNRFLLILLLIILLPLQAFSQKVKDINIIVECVEYVGNDKYVAHFGYDNPNHTEITVVDTNSVLIFNNGKLQVNDGVIDDCPETCLLVGIK